MLRDIYTWVQTSHTFRFLRRWRTWKKIEYLRLLSILRSDIATHEGARQLEGLSDFTSSMGFARITARVATSKARIDIFLHSIRFHDGSGWRPDGGNQKPDLDKHTLVSQIGLTVQGRVTTIHIVQGHPFVAPGRVNHLPKEPTLLSFCLADIHRGTRPRSNNGYAQYRRRTSNRLRLFASYRGSSGDYRATSHLASPLIEFTWQRLASNHDENTNSRTHNIHSNNNIATKCALFYSRPFDVPNYRLYWPTTASLPDATRHAKYCKSIATWEYQFMLLLLTNHSIDNDDTNIREKPEKQSLVALKLDSSAVHRASSDLTMTFAWNNGSQPGFKPSLFALLTPQNMEPTTKSALYSAASTNKSQMTKENNTTNNKDDPLHLEDPTRTIDTRRMRVVFSSWEVPSRTTSYQHLDNNKDNNKDNIYFPFSYATTGGSPLIQPKSVLVMNTI